MNFSYLASRFSAKYVGKLLQVSKKCFYHTNLEQAFVTYVSTHLLTYCCLVSTHLFFCTYSLISNRRKKTRNSNLPGYDILWYDRNRNGIACHVRKDLCFNTRALNCFKEIENIIFDILLPKLKPITISVLYRPNQANFMELLLQSFSLLNLKDKKIYLLGEFNISVYFK